MKILVRLPNWLGDLVMSLAFVDALHKEFPDAAIQVIVKEGLQPILDSRKDILAPIGFSKKHYPGLLGVRTFCQQTLRGTHYDMYVSLPDSFSAAWMGWMAHSPIRIGYRKEGRQLLLTHAYTRNTKQHRVRQYLDLLAHYLDKPISSQEPIMPQSYSGPFHGIVFNTNSEASSRRLPVQKAQQILSNLLKQTDQPITLIGGPGEAAHVEAIAAPHANNPRVINRAGKTTLPELVQIIGHSSGMVSTDSGPAHVANALGTPLVVLFGAGDEQQTAPFNPTRRAIVRLGQLHCEPCQKNTCVYVLPKCLLQLEEDRIVQLLLTVLR